MQTVVETSIFSPKADALLSSRERMDLITLLAWHPLTGDVVPGTGGVRKLRFAGGGRGKRGAFRVIYYALTDELPVVAITLYGKNEKSDLTSAEREGARRIVDVMKAELRRQKAGG